MTGTELLEYLSDLDEEDLDKDVKILGIYNRLIDLDRVSFDYAEEEDYIVLIPNGK